MVKRRKLRTGSLAFDVFLVIVISILTFFFLYPFWDQLVLSFSSPSASWRLGLKFWPSEISLEAYKAVLSFNAVFTGYRETIVRTVSGVSITVVFTFLGAYMLSKKTLPFRGAITFFFLFTMFFSGGLIPSFLLVRSLGLMNSRLSLVLPGITGAWFLILARNFLMALPDALEEAALIDGANPPKILWRIILPLSMPILAVIALHSAVGHWNAWFDCLIYITDRDKFVLQVILRRMLQSVSPEQMMADIGNDLRAFQIPINCVKAAAVMVTIGPIIAVYPFLQKYFIKGVLIGSLKG